MGHFASTCYNRFNREFSKLQVSHNRANNNYGGQTGGNNFDQNSGQSPSPTALVTTHGHHTFTASPETVADVNSYADSGATNHVTVDYNTVANPTEYGGTTCVTIGNGNNLKISHVGNASLTNGRNKLNLENVLYVPTISKNLMNVSQLTQDNRIFIEFHDSYCVVKDNDRGQTLMKGTLE